MATKLVLAQFNGDLTYQNSGVGGTGTSSGALRWKPGRVAGKQAAFVEEGTTNYVPNPSFETGTAGWSAVTGAVLASVTGGVVGSKALSITQPTGVTQSTALATVVSGLGLTGTSLAISGNSKMGAATDVSAGTIYYTDGTFQNFPTATVAADGGWHSWVMLPVVNTAKVIDRINILPKGGGGVPGPITSFHDAFQLETKDHATSYCDGSLGTGYAWTGTAWSSPSTRAATTISIPVGGAPGSVACLFSEDNGATWQFAYQTTLGTLGTYSSLAYSGGNIVVASSRALIIGPLLAFSDTLTAQEQTNLSQYTTWTWTMNLATPPPNGYVEVLPVAGTNANAPVLTLS